MEHLRPLISYEEMDTKIGTFRTNGKDMVITVFFEIEDRRSAEIHKNGKKVKAT